MQLKVARPFNAVDIHCPIANFEQSVFKAFFPTNDNNGAVAMSETESAWLRSSGTALKWSMHHADASRSPRLSSMPFGVSCFHCKQIVVLLVYLVYHHVIGGAAASTDDSTVHEAED
eukprot:scaffold8720_cov16-Prasinocladus_malaysianus.AAC.1